LPGIVSSAAVSAPELQLDCDAGNRNRGDNDARLCSAEVRPDSWKALTASFCVVSPLGSEARQESQRGLVPHHGDVAVLLEGEAAEEGG
jgi:hypothetical protein